MTTKTNWRETQQHTPEDLENPCNVAARALFERYQREYTSLSVMAAKAGLPITKDPLKTYAASQVLKREGEMVELFEKKLITAYRKGVVDEQMQRNTEKEVVAYALQPFIPTPKDELTS